VVAAVVIASVNSYANAHCAALPLSPAAEKEVEFAAEPSVDVKSIRMLQFRCQRSPSRWFGCCSGK
jgi:hypothetical protein